jgi:hypothetical protein
MAIGWCCRTPRGGCERRVFHLPRISQGCSVRLQADFRGPAKAGRYNLLKIALRPSVRSFRTKPVAASIPRVASPCGAHAPRGQISDD